MKAKMNRFLIVALAVGLVLTLLVGSALAFSPVRSWWSPISFFSLNDDTSTRTLTISKDITQSTGYGTKVYSRGSVSAGTYPVTYPSPGKQITWQLYEANWADWYQYSQLKIPAGTVVDIVSDVSYLASDYKSISFSGVGRMYITGGRGATLPWDYVVLTVNGNEISASQASCGTRGSFTMPEVAIDLSSFGDITSLGYRFYYTTGGTGVDEAYSSSTVNIKGHINMTFEDDGFLVGTTPNTPEYEDDFDRVIGWLRSIYSNISETNTLLTNILGNLPNLSSLVEGIQSIITPSDEDQTSVDGFGQQIQDQITEADKIKDTLDSLNTPPPAEIVPDVSTIVTSSDAAVFSNAIGGLFQNTMITNMLLIGLSICFVSYVLFGKK